MADLPSSSSASVDASPILTVSPPPSAGGGACSGSALSELNYAAMSMEWTDDVLCESPGDAAPDVEAAAADEADKDEADDAGARDVGLRPRASVAVPRRGSKNFDQRRLGPANGQGGRNKGSGRETRRNFGRGVRRAVGSYLCETTGAALSTAPGIAVEMGNRTVTMLAEWSREHGREEVWLVPGLFGVLAP